MSTLAIKVFKPQTLRVDAFRLAFLNAARKAGTAIKEDFEATVKDWDEKPEFFVQVSLAGGVMVEVGTENFIYNLIDKGTVGPYEIWAGFYTGKSDKKVLAFASQSTPKTTPNVIGSSAGSIGPIDTYRPYVEHPGIKARNFSKEIHKKWQRAFRTRMEQALREARLASGHAI